MQRREICDRGSRDDKTVSLSDGTDGIIHSELQGMAFTTRAVKQQSLSGATKLVREHDTNYALTFVGK